VADKAGALAEDVSVAEAGILAEDTKEVDAVAETPREAAINAKWGTA
jgi:hypothetical protein